jgi:Lysylphosphatidylglycerol synthase TM region
MRLDVELTDAHTRGGRTGSAARRAVGATIPGRRAAPVTPQRKDDIAQRGPRVKWIAIGVKIGITGLLGWLLLKHVDFAAAGTLLRSERGLTALALAVAVLLAQAVIAAVRMDWVMRLLGTRCPAGRGFAVWMIGLVVSQTLLTFVAGDAARIWQLARRGYPRRVASSAVVLERALGFVVLLAMVLLCEPLLLARASSGAVRTGLTILAIVCAGGILAFAGSAFLGALQGRLPERLRHHRLVDLALDIASVARHLTRSWKLAAAIIASSALMHLGNVLAIFVLARAAGVGIDFTATAARGAAGRVDRADADCACRLGGAGRLDDRRLRPVRRGARRGIGHLDRVRPGHAGREPAGRLFHPLRQGRAGRCPRIGPAMVPAAVRHARCLPKCTPEPP